MLEEVAMEKKLINRPGSVPPKGNGSETRKQDNGSNGRGGRNKRREGPARDTNQGRTPNKQYTEKRPSPRRYNNYGRRQEVTSAFRAEHGSALMEGSKKLNLNHLLNFSFAPRESQTGADGGIGWKRHNRWSRKTSKFNKEQFLQANCQFIVKDSGDYHIHSGDPDTLVAWELIEQVRIYSHDVPSCPICLYPPTAAKITRCGHIYCSSCILHYLSLNDDDDKKRNWRKCPICYDSIYQKDIKSVVALSTHHYTVGETITMKLMKRERGSTYTMPLKQWSEREAKPHHIKDDVDRRFVKLLVATADEVMEEIVTPEQQQLLSQKQEEGESLEASFCDAALEALAAREGELKLTQSAIREAAQVMEQLSLTRPSDQQCEEVLSQWKSNQNASKAYTSAFDDEEEDATSTESPDSPDADDSVDGSETTEDMAEELALPEPDDGDARQKTSESSDTALDGDIEGAVGGMEDTRPHKPSAKAPTATYYFYQASDGQHVYLNSLNARCLIAEYGSLENAPETITAQIVELEAVSMTDELRRRLKYLNHLPLTCEFEVAELLVKAPIVSDQTLSRFQGELEKKRRLRQKKDRDERRRHKKITTEENKKQGIQPGLRHSERQFPEYNTASGAAPMSPTADSAGSSQSSDITPSDSTLNPNASEFTPGSPVSVGSNDGLQETTPVSFAQMLRAGQAKPSSWPNKHAAAASSEPRPSSHHVDSDESENEDRIPVPQFQASFGDAIQAALDKAKDSKEVKAGATSGKKKRKVGKKTLLFTTTMARNG